MGNCLFLAMPYTREMYNSESQNDSNHESGNRSLFDDFKSTAMGRTVVSPTARTNTVANRP